jgi:hypothetical protein
MDTLLQQIQQHASVLPPALQVERLNYAIDLEQQAKAQHRSELPEHIRRQRLAEALENAAALNPFRDIEDPVA